MKVSVHSEAMEVDAEPLDMATLARLYPALPSTGSPTHDPAACLELTQLLARQLERKHSDSVRCCRCTQLV